MRFVRFITTAALVTGLLAAGASPAGAHDVLLSTDPAPDSTIAGAQDRITLNFAAPPLAGLESAITIQVTDPAGTDVTDGTVNIDGATLTTGVDLSTAGTYQVGWRSVSEDGHPISGTSVFTSTGAAPATTSTSSPIPTTSAPAAAAPLETEADTSHTSDSAAENATAIMLWILGGLAALFIIGLAVIGYIGRKSKRDSPTSDTSRK
jgi:methionine-rich copper-binding protein CopC